MINKSKTYDRRKDPARRSRGGTHGMAKLKEGQVRAIRKLKLYGVTYENLTKIFGVCETVLRTEVVSGEGWKHVETYEVWR